MEHVGEWARIQKRSSTSYQVPVCPYTYEVYGSYRYSTIKHRYRAGGHRNPGGVLNVEINGRVWLRYVELNKKGRDRQGIAVCHPWSVSAGLRTPKIVASNEVFNHIS